MISIIRFVNHGLFSSVAVQCNLTTCTLHNSPHHNNQSYAEYGSRIAMYLGRSALSPTHAAMIAITPSFPEPRARVRMCEGVVPLPSTAVLPRPSLALCYQKYP